MTTPKVSVVVATCGRPELVLDCIDSILKNDFDDYEVLVVDQDPARGLDPLLGKRFGKDPRVRYFFLEPPGLSRARNTGLEHARGQFVVFIDDDAEVERSWIGAYVEAFTSIHPTPGLVAGQIVPLWLSAKPSWYPEEREYLLGLYTEKGSDLIPMPAGDLPVGANFGMLRELVAKLGHFDDRVGFSYSRRSSMIAGEDSLFARKALLANYSIYYQPRALARHKISASKLTRTYFLKRNFWEGVTVVVILHLSGMNEAASFKGIIRWHAKAIGLQLWRALVPGQGHWRDFLQAKGRMRVAAACAYSLGAVYASLRYLKTGQLP